MDSVRTVATWFAGIFVGGLFMMAATSAASIL
jgi:hypothetical protein